MRKLRTTAVLRFQLRPQRASRFSKHGERRLEIADRRRDRACVAGRLHIMSALANASEASLAILAHQKFRKQQSRSIFVTKGSYGAAVVRLAMIQNHATLLHSEPLKLRAADDRLKPRHRGLRSRNHVVDDFLKLLAR